MTQISETRRRAGSALLADCVARMLQGLLDADRRYRDAVRFRNLPPELLDDIGLPPSAGAAWIAPPFQSPGW